MAPVARAFVSRNGTVYRRCPVWLADPLAVELVHLWQTLERGGTYAPLEETPSLVDALGVIGSYVATLRVERAEKEAGQGAPLTTPVGMVPRGAVPVRGV